MAYAFPGLVVLLLFELTRQEPFLSGMTWINAIGQGAMNQRTGRTIARRQGNTSAVHRHRCAAGFQSSLSPLGVNRYRGIQRQFRPMSVCFESESKIRDLPYGAMSLCGLMVLPGA